ncbi:hypothetical protein J4526_07665 [Desulfurococcaceae archaeon MEX13E-LK6-19]|nr:hypothetical protein J4526_07665 [Desulfurococcaceae archaeon MEX13E-LK6-19]
MDLPVPPEPKDIKIFIKEQRKRLGSAPDIDYDSLAVWYLNKLPSYLWRHWKQVLESKGYTWQKFIKVLKYSTNDVIEWALYDKLEWNELVNRLSNILNRYATIKG